MRIGLLTQWFDPEPGPAALPGVLARGLVARGHEVQVLTGFPNYPSGTIADGYRVRPRTDEHRDGVDIRRTALYASHDASALRRFANYASFGLSAATLGVGALRDVDAVWVNYSPITTAWPMWANQLLHRVPGGYRMLGGLRIGDQLAMRPDSIPSRPWADLEKHCVFLGNAKIKALVASHSAPTFVT